MLDDRQEAATHPEASDLRDDSGAILSDIVEQVAAAIEGNNAAALADLVGGWHEADLGDLLAALDPPLRPRLIELLGAGFDFRSEEHTSELQSRRDLVCRLLLEKKK